MSSQSEPSPIFNICTTAGDNRGIDRKKDFVVAVRPGAEAGTAVLALGSHDGIRL